MFELLVAFAWCPVIYSQYDCCLKILLMFGFSCTKLQKINKKIDKKKLISSQFLVSMLCLVWEGWQLVVWTPQHYGMWVFPKWSDEGRGTRWPPQISELWGEVEHSTEAGISSHHHQYPKPGEETFIRVTGQSSMAERKPGKSVIPHSLYWDLLKLLISIFSRWLYLSFPATGVLHRVFVELHLYSVSHLLFEDLRAETKASF